VISRAPFSRRNNDRIPDTGGGWMGAPHLAHGRDAVTLCLRSTFWGGVHPKPRIPVMAEPTITPASPLLDLNLNPAEIPPPEVSESWLVPIDKVLPGLYFFGGEFFWGRFSQSIQSSVELTKWRQGPGYVC